MALRPTERPLAPTDDEDATETRALNLIAHEHERRLINAELEAMWRQFDEALAPLALWANRWFAWAFQFWRSRARTVGRGLWRALVERSGVLAREQVGLKFGS